MFQLWSVRVDGGDGKAIYGEDYADVYAMNRVHYMATTNDTCDHVGNHFRALRHLSAVPLQFVTMKNTMKRVD